jgi:cytochrome c oxidase subunit 1
MGRLLINRWLLSTNAKDIGVLYIIFAGLSGLVGSSLSFKIRKELSGGGNVYILGNYHDYNVTITGHAI